MSVSIRLARIVAAATSVSLSAPHLAAAAPTQPGASAEVAAADPVEVCLSAHEQGQVARQSANLLDGRELLRACAADHCPNLVRKDCLGWLADLQGTIPSVSFFGVLDGAPVKLETVWLDGEEVSAETLAGQLEIDPGAHAFTAQIQIDGEASQAETTIVVSPSVRRQVVRFEFHNADPVTDAPAPILPGPPEDEVHIDTGKPLRVAGYVTLGLGVSAGIGWIVAGSLGLRDRRRADSECAPFCDGPRVTRVQRELLAADALAGATAVFSVVAAVLLSVGYKRRRARPSASASIVPGGATLGLHWRI